MARITGCVSSLRIQVGDSPWKYQGQQGDVNQSVRGNYKIRFGGGIIVVPLFLILSISLCLQFNPSVEVLLSARFWTTISGHRCFPFSPPVLAFIFISHRVQNSHSSAYLIVVADIHRVLLTRPLALSASQFYLKQTRKYFTHNTSTRMHAVRIEPTTLTLIGTIFAC